MQSRDLARTAGDQLGGNDAPPGAAVVTVDSVEASRGKLEALVQSAGGYIDSTQVEQHGTSSTATIVIRIPADSFGKAIRYRRRPPPPCS